MSITVTGRVFVWAHMIKENWEVFAPGFRSLAHNQEHVESETEFDLNPTEEANAKDEDMEDEEVRAAPVTYL